MIWDTKEENFDVSRDVKFYEDNSVNDASTIEVYGRITIK